MAAELTKQLFFVGDPMCSWCWGFSPALQGIRDAAKGRASLRVVMGGLRPGTDNLMDDKMKGYVRHHWEEVQARTGQPFDFAMFERDGFVYNTEPACRAVVVARNLSFGTGLEGVEVDLFDAIQEAFYAKNTDVTDPHVLRDLAVGLGLDADAFTEAFNDTETIEKTFGDFMEARRMGVQGFPTVVAFDAEGNDGKGAYGYVTVGYRPWDNLKDDLEAWLAA